MVPQHGPLSFVARFEGPSIVKLDDFPVVRSLDDFQRPFHFHGHGSCTTTLNMTFIVNHYSQLYIPISLYNNVILLPRKEVKCFYNVQTTNSIFVGKENEMYNKQL